MIETQIEAMLASPPERDELVVQLFAKDGGQWAEIYRDKNAYWIDMYMPDSTTKRFNLDAMVEVLVRSKTELTARFESR